MGLHNSNLIKVDNDLMFFFYLLRHILDRRNSKEQEKISR